MEVAALKVAVIGGGSFGTALAKIFSENLGHCSWWMHNSDSALHVMRYHHNPRYLSSVGFQPDTISVYTDVSDCAKEADIIVLAVPSAFIKEVLADLSPELLKNKIIATTIKGIIPDENMIVGRYLNEVLGVPEEQIVENEEQDNVVVVPQEVKTLRDKLVEFDRDIICTKFPNTDENEKILIKCPICRQSNELDINQKKISGSTDKCCVCLDKEIEMIVIATPSQSIKDLVEKIDFSNYKPLIVSVSKGLEKESGKTMSQVIALNPHISDSQI